MRLFQPLLLLAALFLLAASPSKNTSNPRTIAQNNNDFAFDLYKEIAQNEKGNLFFSPFSISTALAMTYAGAGELTEAEMAKTLHFPPNTEGFHLAYGDYLNLLEKNAGGNIKWSVANRLWGEKDYALKKDFINLNKRAYDSPLEKMNFIGQPEDCRITINDWVADKTEQRIQNLLVEGTVTTDTRLILTNAVYFKGDWLYKFDKKNTKDRKFKKADGSSKKTPFMNFTGAFNYSATEKYQIIKLPYKGEKQSMVVVLPNETEWLPEVEASINSAAFEPLFYDYLPEVILSLPKFKLTLPLSLNTPLKNLGMNEAFTSQANFSKMTASNNLAISEVVHKAFVEIDEEGTEAAAATAVVVVLTSTVVTEIKPIEFKADHPFLFYIIDDETRAILFMGRVMEPILD